MALLKKIKAATLMETLVATVLIFVVFMLASGILNNLLLNTIKNNTRLVDTRLYELEYLWLSDQLQLPYDEDLNDWSITVGKVKGNDYNHIVIEAKHKDTRKTIERILLDD
ncbi:MAG: hypothetical protein MK212_22555 [Saprospiraceae bacterium]|nr:hypothetical protein [Saprospiraceae bacterium]